MITLTPPSRKAPQQKSLTAIITHRAGLPAFSLACLVFAAALVAPGQAARPQAAHYTPWQKHGAYDVEVLVFSRGTHASALPAEQVEPVDLSETIALQAKPANWPEWKWATPAQTPSPDEGQWTMPMDEQKPQVLVDYRRQDIFLQKTAAKLGQQPGWRVLLHRKWRLQPSDFQQPVYLDLSTTTRHTAAQASQEQLEKMPGVGSGMAFDQPQMADTAGLVGKLAFSKGRYLHIDAELQKTSPNPHGARVSVLKEKRRVHSKVLQYFDHPDFGLLVLITPLQVPPAPAANPPREEEQKSPPAKGTDTADKNTSFNHPHAGESQP